MKTSELKEYMTKTTAELDTDLKAKKSELFNLRFQLATGQLENTMQISSVKRDIARALTVQTQAGKKAAQK